MPAVNLTVTDKNIVISTNFFLSIIKKFLLERAKVKGKTGQIETT